MKIDSLWYVVTMPREAEPVARVELSRCRNDHLAAVMEFRQAATPVANGLGKRLICPYCGSDIEAELSYTTVSFSEHRDLTGYECESYECDARWTNRGDVERLPKHLRNPSSEESV
jgi:hypothetical protein